MTEYYEKKLKQGLEYQDFVFDQLRKMDAMPIFLGSYASQEYQYKKGESLSGLEIKYDDKLKTTGNLYIEYQEKTEASNIDFKPSGIMRDDNTWLYLIGNYEQAFIFMKKALKAYCLWALDKALIEAKTCSQGTSRGYILPMKLALENAYLGGHHIIFSK